MVNPSGHLLDVRPPKDVDLTLIAALPINGLVVHTATAEAIRKKVRSRRHTLEYSRYRMPLVGVRWTGQCPQVCSLTLALSLHLSLTARLGETSSLGPAAAGTLKSEGRRTWRA
jgi:hypothetical protein